MDPTRIICVEDSQEYRKAIEYGLGSLPDMMVTELFSTAEAALRSFSSDRRAPDIVLLDLMLPGVSGLDSIPQFLKTLTESKILVLTESEESEDILKAMSLGAQGYLLKSASLLEIVEGIRTVMKGGISINPFMVKYLLKSQKQSGVEIDKPILTHRESQVLRLLAEGDSRKQISVKLEISTRTVDFHIQHIFEKLDSPNAPSAIAKAFKMGIIK